MVEQPEMIHLIYNSAATTEFTNQDLLDLLEKARNNNAAKDITGMLLFVDGCFFQILEGPEDAVDALAEQISRDPRHTRMTVIIREPIGRRSFNEWTMAFAEMSAEDLGSIEGVNDFFDGQRVLTDIDHGRAKKLLAAFGRGRWRVRLAAKPTSAARESPVTAEPPSNREMEPRPNFSFAFQPIVKGDSQAVVGYEAIVRGERDEPTAQVLQRIPLVEVAAFEADSRRRAIAMASRLGLEQDLHLSIVPRSAHSDEDSLASALQTASQCGIEPARMVVELKHEMSLNDPPALADWLKDYRRAGMRFSIGDFGSGHAGLALLDHYQPELISLSMWLVRGIEGHGPRQAIVRGLAQTCGDLGIDLLAKGVNTADEFEWLLDEGVEMFQGSLFAMPGFESLPRLLLPVG